jgi:hypothetical protein
MAHFNLVSFVFATLNPFNLCFSVTHICSEWMSIMGYTPFQDHQLVIVVSVERPEEA